MKKGVAVRMTLCILLVWCLAVNAIQLSAKEKGEKNSDKKNGSVHILLDPGHGGEQSGAEISVGKKTISEKEVNLKIAFYLKEELLNYADVEVSMTREGDWAVSLEGRSKQAEEEGADILISLHNNAKGKCCEYDNGCTVLVSKGQYREDIAQQEQELGVNILYELSGLGLSNQGLLLRTSEKEEVYANGELADYYALVRAGINSGIPAIIIEHAFLDNKEDYENYLNDEGKLKQLARADARGIARYYQFREKESGKILPSLSNVEEKLVLVKDGLAAHNEISSKLFYPSEGKAVRITRTEEKTEAAANTAQETGLAESDKKTKGKSSFLERIWKVLSKIMKGEKGDI